MQRNWGIFFHVIKSTKIISEKKSLKCNIFLQKKEL